MPRSLVIVESPAKARTIAGYLGDEYVVESSIGHVRDLPSNASEIPKAYKTESWSRLGVDVQNDFKPLYVIPARAKSQVSHLRSILKNGDIETLYLATDEDREGEAIAWHLMEVLNPQVPVQRMVFHEITKQAITEAIESPRELDRCLVDAQEARRIFDRLYGYEMSPVLWRKVQPKLSAGRVQSVANRLIVERERERMDFVRASYWSLKVSLAAQTDTSQTSAQFETRLISVDGQRVAVSGDFDAKGALAANGKAGASDAVVLDEVLASNLSEAVVGATFAVSSRESKPYRRRPAAPFITSTLQQTAGNLFGFSSARTMTAAQRLYEAGFITYMRTDSNTLSQQALATARAVGAENFGKTKVAESPRRYSSKSKNAQEAHEAIRPAGDSWKSPGSIKQLGNDAQRLYDLIWQRTVASQMKDVVGETVTIKLKGAVSSADVESCELELQTSGTVIADLGWQAIYGQAGEPKTDPAAAPSSGESDAESDTASDTAEQKMPDLAEGDETVARSAEPKGHETQPPARFSEASLVRRLEEIGVGRPSTYASIMETIQNRGYVWKKGGALVPSWVAFVTVSLMEQHYGQLVDYELTARMESDLDRIAAGEKELVPWLTDFYFGPETNKGLVHLVSDEFLADIDPAALNRIAIKAGDSDDLSAESPASDSPASDSPEEPGSAAERHDPDEIVVRVGRYGPYLRRGEETRPLPEGLTPDELTPELADKLLAEPTENVLGVDPETGTEVIALPGRFGPYVSLGRRTDDSPKPKTASLLKGMSLKTITLDDALRLLSLPRTVGEDSDGTPIVVQNGRYGPYLTRGDDSRSLESEEQLFTLTVPEALALLAQPSRRNRRRNDPLRELGKDPVSGNPVVLKDGRFGLYVSDGEVNASLRVGDEAESLTIERAAELLVLRREYLAANPSKARKTTRKPAKKTTKKPSKKPTKKTTRKPSQKPA